MTSASSPARMNRRVVLAKRPKGNVSGENFRIEDVALEPLADGEFLVNNRYLSLDPYMRGRMDDAKSYAKPVEVGEVMGGGTVGEVVESRHPDFAVGDQVLGPLGWQLYARSTGAGVQKLPQSKVPLTAYLGVVGMPGVTAWYGLNRILEPQSGQTAVRECRQRRRRLGRGTARQGGRVPGGRHCRRRAQMPSGGGAVRIRRLRRLQGGAAGGGPGGRYARMASTWCSRTSAASSWMRFSRA